MIDRGGANMGRRGGLLERSPDPTEHEIAAACRRLQAGWLDGEFSIRRILCGDELARTLKRLRSERWIAGASSGGC